MNIHEYQGKELFRKYGIPVPKGVPAFDVASAVKAAEQPDRPMRFAVAGCSAR